jgi:hypothetical protein
VISIHVTERGGLVALVVSLRGDEVTRFNGVSGDPAQRPGTDTVTPPRSTYRTVSVWREDKG